MPVNKSDMISVRLRPGDKVILQKAADAVGEPLSEWVRDRALKAAKNENRAAQKRQGVYPLPEGEEQDPL
jgi:uncharacterized protein (DUF1778 family)